MNRRWIKINGVDISTWGVRVMKLPPITIAQERILEYRIPGRAEPLTERTGEYDPKKMVAEIHIDSDDPAEAVYKMLAAQEVEFSNDSGFLYDCMIIDYLSLNRQILNWHTFPVAFRCEPLKRLVSETEYTGPFLVQGTEAAKPVITVSINSPTLINADITMAGASLIIQNVTGEIIIDTPNRTVWSDGQNITNRAYGEFPLLTPGGTVEAVATNASTSEALPVTVKPNFRWR